MAVSCDGSLTKQFGKRSLTASTIPVVSFMGMTHLFIVLVGALVVASIILEGLDWIIGGIVAVIVGALLWKLFFTIEGLKGLLVMGVFFGPAAGILWIRDKMRARNTPPKPVIARPARPTAAEESAALLARVRRQIDTAPPGPPPPLDYSGEW